jgi:hypothetical protein
LAKHFCSGTALGRTTQICTAVDRCHEVRSDVGRSPDARLARDDGRYARMLTSLARVQVLILEDWGLTLLTAEQRRLPGKAYPGWSGRRAPISMTTSI